MMKTIHSLNSQLKSGARIFIMILIPTICKSPMVSAQMLAGTGKCSISAASGDVHDSLYVKALVIQSAQTKLAILTMDVVAIGTIGDIPDNFNTRMHQRLKAEFDIGHVLISASHNHLDGFLNGGNKLIANPEDSALSAVRKALKNLEAVHAGSGSGFEDRFAMNRRIHLKDGKVYTIRHANPNMPEEEIDHLGEIDPQIGILKLDRIDGTTKAVIYNYACHPYTGVPGKEVTAEFPGFASRLIENQLAHGSMAFFLQGAAGDITEILYKDVNSPRDCEPFGNMLGQRVLTSLKDIHPATSATVKIVGETVRLPLRTDIPDRLKNMEKEERDLLASLRSTSLNMKTFIPLYIKYHLSPEYPSYDAYRYLQEEKTGNRGLVKMDEENQKDMKKYLENIHAMEKLAQIQENRAILLLRQADIEKLNDDYLSVEINVIQIGNFILATFPGEAFSRVGMNIKVSSAFPNTFLACYTNGYIHYAPTADAYPEGGYEVMNTLLAPGWQTIFETEIQKLIRRL